MLTHHRLRSKMELYINLSPITKAEVVDAIKKIKNSKVPGPGNIPPEVIKADTGLSANIMNNLCGKRSKWQWNGRQVILL